MNGIIALAVFFAVIAGMLWMIVAPLWFAARDSRDDRFRMVKYGAIAQGLITGIDAARNDGMVRVAFTFTPLGGGAACHGSQRLASAAVERLHLTEGMPVRVRHGPGRRSFLDEISFRARLIEAGWTDSDGAPAAIAPRIFYVRYLPTRSCRWSGSGEILMSQRGVIFIALQRRPFRSSRRVWQPVAREDLSDVDFARERVSLRIGSGPSPLVVGLLAVSGEEAQALAAALPARRSADFVPALSEMAAYQAALESLNPRTPVNRALIGLNLMMFVIATALGGGLLQINPEVMIRLGTDYTPLTMSGQWWRLLSSMFLHFGIIHVGANMWALYVNGRLAERIFGSARYLTIYLVAGLSGSVASLLWHPIVNGAGASGAIFGVLGAMLAFFLRKAGGVPASVIKSQSRSVLVFVIYNLAYAAEVRFIDNAAHLGGLAGGLVMGWILSRPLDPSRDARNWNRQWAASAAVVALAALAIAFGVSRGLLGPAFARAPDGRPIPAAHLAPVASLGGIALGMTRGEVIRAKGDPQLKNANLWVYGGGGMPPTGQLTVIFAVNAKSPTVRMILYRPSAARLDVPSELPDLSGQSLSVILKLYGRPLKRLDGNGVTNFYFANGVVVADAGGGVAYYGIFDPLHLDI